MLLIAASLSATSMSARGRIYTTVSDVPVKPVAVVFGAGVLPNGTLSLMLKDRLDAAIALIQEGKVTKLLLTGDHGRKDYDEVAAMSAYLLENGVPAAAVTLDHAGFDTYDSCYRARAIFGVTDAVLITQRYHMPRALFLCRKLGVSAVGYAQPDWDKYPELKVPYSSREALAKVKAVWQGTVTQPPPKYLGKFEGLTGIVPPDR